MDKLHSYSYWIISGLHSIHAAKIYILSSTHRCLATKHLYATRNARILVDCPAEMCIELSRMTNMESHNVMKNGPYLEQLQQVRDQWIAFGSPPKPQQGLPKGSPQRVPWEVMMYNLSFSYSRCIWCFLSLSHFVFLFLIEIYRIHWRKVCIT